MRAGILKMIPDTNIIIYVCNGVGKDPVVKHSTFNCPAGSRKAISQRKFGARILGGMGAHGQVLFAQRTQGTHANKKMGHSFFKGTIGTGLRSQGD